MLSNPSGPHAGRRSCDHLCTLSHLNHRCPITSHTLGSFFFFASQDRSQVSQACLKLCGERGFYSPISCLHLPSSGITSVWLLTPENGTWGTMHGRHLLETTSFCNNRDGKTECKSQIEDLFSSRKHVQLCQGRWEFSLPPASKGHGKIHFHRRFSLAFF